MAIIEQGAPATDDVVDNETKADKFKRLMNKRMTVALDKIRLIGNLSNKATYEYTDEQIAKVISTLRNDIDWLEREFAPKSAESKRVFEL